MNNDQQSIAYVPQLETIPDSARIEVWARIKKSSKYYQQGLTDDCEGPPKAAFFRLTSFCPVPRQREMLWRGSYVLRFNDNNYRLEDCELFLVDGKDRQILFRIV